MAKRKSFEEILDSEIRWPTQGDKAFVTSADPSENANIDECERLRLMQMTDGYKKAGDLMAEAAGHDSVLRDTLVFPIIFNYRHFLEISLKYLLASFGSPVGIGPNWRSQESPSDVVGIAVKCVRICTCPRND